ncbi:unnamed protein product [Rodentolepis nana]|uniref:Uncharacterized protein n=1 Tax=Rodentolepis nana TaxID=102285 RepID=A0A0R3TJW7_RODNA|nr:unnamed protein product [Rodentolepis nana]
MSLSRCIDLSKTRDFIHVGNEIIYFTEADKSFRIFLYIPKKVQGFSSIFQIAFLKALARQYNFPNIQLLLTWLRDQTSNGNFLVQATDTENVSLVFGTNPSIQLTFQLSQTQSDADLILSLSKALNSKQGYLAELENSNAAALGKLNAQDALPVVQNKRKKLGMSSTNPQRRRRKPATGLTFVSDDDND